MMSLPATLDEVSEWLKSHYSFLASVECQLLRSYTNDVYLVSTPSRRYVLKIYGRYWRTGAEIAYEVELLQYLGAAGMRIASPVASDSGFVHLIEVAGESRHAVLFDYADGEKPQSPFTPVLYFAFGRAIARMHTLSTDFVTRHSRPPLNLDRLLAEPVAQVVPLLAEARDRAFLSRLAGRLDEKIASFASRGLEWGPIHGDASLDNLHLTEDGDVILYDFDSGGPGWRAADLQGWAHHNPAYREKWDAFYEGYWDIRRLDAVNVLAAPYLTLVWDIWGMKIDLDNRILQQGSERTEEYLIEETKQLRVRCEQIGLPRERLITWEHS